MVEARPFDPFTILLEGGYAIDVLSNEFISLEEAVQFATVYDAAGHRCYFSVDRIVALQTIHPVHP
jgi:hypothetical protein